MSDFTHFDADGNAVMVDVSGKPATVRQAVATGRILMSEQCFAAVRAGRIGKGDVLGVARIAGIMALKRTPEWIPLCHTIPIEKAAVDFALLDELCAVEVRCTVRTTGATGVEMEALTGVTAALLTVYDMCKAVDKSMRIEGVHLVEKTGGKSGVYRYADTRRADGTPGGEGVR